MGVYRLVMIRFALITFYMIVCPTVISDLLFALQR